MSGIGESIMSKINFPKYIPNQFNVFQLIKICKTEQYRNDFISGRLYMSTIENISNIERKELTKGQCDRIEGTEEFWQSTKENYMAMDYSNDKYVFKYFDKEPSDKTNLVEIYNVERGRYKNIYKNIYCMYTLWLNIQQKKVFDVSYKLIESFGDYATIILEPYIFLERINKSISNYIENKMIFNSKPTIGFVEYIDFKNKGIIPLGVYKKRDAFIYQNEFRLCLDIEDNKDDLCYFEVGDLSDIVIKVSTTDLVYNTRVVDDSLIIGNKKINFNLSKMI